MFDAAARRRIRTNLLRWYGRNARDLPWRRTRDPYRILLAETMLQQTRVETVLRYYDRFLERFPTVEALADAPLDDVLSAWAGLGYYRRARNLHAAARTIVERFGGQVPQTVEALRALPGVGRYTAGAVASIAFDRRAPVLDGNVRRVLSRLAGWRSAGEARLWSLAGELLPCRRCGDFNQALMELGATLCSPTRPACQRCPLRTVCNAAASGSQRQTGRGRTRTRPRSVHAAAVAVERRGRLLLVRRDSGGLLAGLWGLPSIELTDGQDAPGRLATLLERDFDLTAERFERLGEIEHIFTHRRLRLAVYRARGVRGRVRAGREVCRWVDARAVQGDGGRPLADRRRTRAGIGQPGAAVPHSQPEATVPHGQPGAAGPHFRQSGAGVCHTAEQAAVPALSSLDRKVLALVVAVRAQPSA